MTARRSSGFPSPSLICHRALLRTRGLDHRPVLRLRHHPGGGRATGPAAVGCEADARRAAFSAARLRHPDRVAHGRCEDLTPLPVATFRAAVHQPSLRELPTPATTTTTPRPTSRTPVACSRPRPAAGPGRHGRRGGIPATTGQSHTSAGLAARRRAERDLPAEGRPSASTPAAQRRPLDTATPTSWSSTPLGHPRTTTRLD